VIPFWVFLPIAGDGPQVCRGCLRKPKWVFEPVRNSKAAGRSAYVRHFLEK